MRPTLALALALALVLAGCGGISNDELQLLALLPDDTLAMSTPDDQGQALTSDDYGRVGQAADGRQLAVLPHAATTAAGINAFVHAIVEHVGAVTSRRPTTREGQRLTWGPFALRNGKGYARVTVERDPTAACPGEASPADDGRPRLRFSVELSGRKDKEFRGMVGGTVHGDFFDRSCGTMHFDRQVFKAFGGTGGVRDPDGVDLGWDRDDAHQELTASIDDDKQGDFVAGSTYRFTRRLSDGSAAFTFTRRADVEGNGGVQRLDAALQWGPQGQAGRADFRLQRPVRAPLTGTACWQPPGGHYYADSDNRVAGVPATCGAFAAVPLP